MQQCGLQGGWDPMPTRTPNTRGGERAPTVPKWGEWVAGRGWGLVWGCLLPVGHTRGAIPVITASTTKLQSRAGASLPLPGHPA